MKLFFVGVATVVMALTVGLVLGMYAMYSPPGPKQPANAFANREPPRVIETKKPEPETTGLASPEPRQAVAKLPSESQATELSAAQKKKAERQEAAERRKADRAERKARRQEARQREARRRSRDAFASGNSSQQDDFGWNSYGFR